MPQIAFAALGLRLYGHFFILILVLCEMPANVE
jgi:hypothetical protein